MKKLLVTVLVFACFTASAQISSFPYSEDFESGAGGWASASSNFVDSWVLGTPNYSVINQAAPGGTMSWYTDTTDYETSEYSHVISPEFDFSGLSYPWIELDIWWDLVTDMDGAVLQSSTNGGSSWDNVGHHDDNAAMATNWYNHAFLSIGFPNGGAGLQQISHWSGDSLQGSQGWLTASHYLEGLGGESSVMFRFAWANRGGNGNRPADNVAFDNVLIYEGPEVDLSVTAVDQAGPCGGGYEGQAYITISNLGGNSATITEIEDDQGNTYPLDSPVTIDPFSTERILVSLPLQNPGTPTMVLGVEHQDDLNTDNDFMSVTFDCQVINGQSHCNDFEAGGTQPWWVDPESVNPSFVLGPNTSNTSINTPPASGGAQFWATTNEFGEYNPLEQSAIISNFFNLGGLENVVVALNLYFDIETDYDGGVMQYSLDGGQTWVTLGSQGTGSNWYNAGGLYGPGAGGQNAAHWNGDGPFGSFGWVLAVSANLTALQGEENVLFRVAIGSDNIVQSGGIGIDNFCISGEPVSEPDTPMVVINEFNYIDIDGDLKDFIELKNVGSDTIVMADLKVQHWANVGGGATAIYTIENTDFGSDVLAPGDYYVISVEGGVANADLEYFLASSEALERDTGAIVVSYVPLSDLILDEVGYGQNLANHFEAALILTEDPGDFLATDIGLSRIFDGQDSDNNSADFALRCVTPGAANSTSTYCLPNDTVDVGIIGATQIGPCGGGFNTSISVRFENVGYFTQTITQVEDLNGNTYVLNPPLTLDANETGESIISVSNPGQGLVNITLFVDQPGDGNNFNDSFFGELECIVYDALNYSNDFEDPEIGEWYEFEQDDDLSSWNLGANLNNYSINTPSPVSVGTQFWATNNDGGYNQDESSSIVSSYFDFTNVPEPVIKAEINWELESGIDGVVLEYSLNGGADWETVGTMQTGTNWYNTGSLPIGGAGDQNDVHWSGDGANSSQGWVTAAQYVPEIAGQPNVLLRFAIHADNSAVIHGGFGFDDFEILAPEIPEVVINEFNYVDFRGEQYDFVELKNVGTENVMLDDLELEFRSSVGGLSSTYFTVNTMTGILGPGAYYLIGDTSGLLIPDLAVFDTLGAVAADTAAIILRHASSTLIVDRVGYGNNVAGFFETNAITMADPGDHLHRDAGFSRVPDGADSNNNIQDFAYRCITPGYANEPTDSLCVSANIIINEFNYSDPSGEAFDFVELRNNDVADVDLGNYELRVNDFGIVTTVALNGVLSPNDYYVIGAMNGVQNADLSFALASDYLNDVGASISVRFLPKSLTTDLVGMSPSAPTFEGAAIALDDEGAFLDYTIGFSRVPNGNDTDNNLADFARVCHTPGEENGMDSTCVSVMVINEVDKMGATGDSVHVELFNKTPIQGDLDGFILEFDDATNLDSIILDGTIGNQGYRVFSIPSSGFDSDHVTIMLQDTQSTTIVDRLTIAQTPVGLPNTENEFTSLDASQTLSISRIPNGEDTNDNGNDFALICATLGSENFNDLSCDLVGIGEELEVGIKFYPNPAKDLITIETGSSDQFDIQILDGMGRTASSAVISNQNRIDISSLIPGVYSIIATDPEGKSASGRFIKQ